MLSTEKLEKVWAGRSAEERGQLEGRLFAPLQGPNQF